ncbi:hypothetical protein LINGRAHAP2_LOCUS4849 [Linum grandiflorum]
MTATHFSFVDAPHLYRALKHGTPVKPRSMAYLLFVISPWALCNQVGTH